MLGPVGKKHNFGSRGGGRQEKRKWEDCQAIGGLPKGLGKQTGKKAIQR